jgi:hypothetical protein
MAPSNGGAWLRLSSAAKIVASGSTTLL